MLVGTNVGNDNRCIRRGRGNEEVDVDKQCMLLLLTMYQIEVNNAVAAILQTMPRPRAPPKPRTRVNIHVVLDEIEDADLFRSQFRMDRVAFNNLARLLEPHLKRRSHSREVMTGEEALVPEFIVAIGLQFLAGSRYGDICIIYGISRQTVYKACWEFVAAVNKGSDVGPFKLPTTEEECKQLAQEWKDIGPGFFEHLVLATDGLLLKTRAPSPCDTRNVLRYFSGSKKAYGLNIHAACDRQGQFMGVSTMSPGSTNDSTAWQSSQMSKLTERLPGGHYVIGDNAYPNSERLMTPYAGSSISQEKDTYNFHLNQCRIGVEMAFGVLVCRWGILWKPLRVAFRRRPMLIRALFHLHNFCVDERVSAVQASEDKGRGKGARPPLTRRHKDGLSQWVLGDDWDTGDGEPDRLPGDTVLRTKHVARVSRMSLRRPNSNILRNINLDI